ncbi:30S ribosomal protein S6--L-glutamate ligase [Pantoea sp. Aalb]|uniref:30S ribosomal protein S6--L-glutamate ligase n=1 Tax=Pantoea sp. Aalb TaxID=2576762 RepID=UPI00132366A7|nr:30S ribosomal protein S6--L-glutamate ligase [Pantoea sp. Aalb]MXP67504.1 30S ribosomal protein S6--L-glutamate ligase [Pantoea sp. Aalb]
MKMAILSRDKSLYSCKRLHDIAKKRGHKVQIIDVHYCYFNIQSHLTTLQYQGKQLGYFDAVIPRISTTNTFCGTTALRYFETCGTYTLNKSIAIIRAHDKLCSLQLLASQGIDMPITSFSSSFKDTKDLISIVGGAPLIIKLIEGSQGIGVVLAETSKAAESIIDAFHRLNSYILVQEFIKEAKGRDIRCLVIGNEVVASIERKAKKGSFRSNLHCGGKAKSISITKQERNLAIKAANIIGLEVAGVDILRANRGPLVMEVNASPGLEGIENATGINIASMMIDWIEKTYLNK